MKLERKHGKIEKKDAKTAQINKIEVAKTNLAWQEWQNYKNTIEKLAKNA